MANIIVDIACTAYYQVSLCYGESCVFACDCTSPSIFYSDCPAASLNVGCHLFNSSGIDAPLGYYSDGTFCYQYAVSSEVSVITSKTSCVTPDCDCFGYSVVSCEDAITNHSSC